MRDTRQATDVAGYANFHQPGIANVVRGQSGSLAFSCLFVFAAHLATQRCSMQWISGSTAELQPETTAGTRLHTIMALTTPAVSSMTPRSLEALPPRMATSCKHSIHG
ncbi:TPA: hypothetical protein ACH3X2_012590 [Trebouxia sp. C0005]